MSPLAGTHCLLDLYGCPRDRLEDAAIVRRAVARAVEAAGARLIEVVVHEFPGGGVSAIALLAESHLSVHTWPEHGYAGVDVYTCGEETDPQAAARSLAESLAAADRELRTVGRPVVR